MALSKWAIIDIGSNTIRLVIYKMNPFGSMKETDNIKASARLRNYVNKEGVLDEEGKRILVNTLKGFKEIADFQGIEEVICVATAALRQAKNKQSIVCEIKEVTGFEVRILTEEEEAFYGFYAVVNSTTQQDGITIDIGGGSTEITYFKKRKLIYSHSYPFGVVSLKEQFMSSGTMNGQECAALQQFLQRKFKELPWLHRLSVPIVAIGGSARNVAQIHQNIIKYPIAGIHQYKMELRDLLMMKEMMSQMTISDLEKLEGLSKERADIILPALEVFVQLCFYSNSNEFIFSRRGLRDGIYFKEYKLHNHSGSSEEIADESISELLNDYGVDKNHSDKVSSLAGQLASELVKMYPAALSKDFISDILIAARAYFLGDYLDTDASSQHTFYLLANQSLDGLEHLLQPFGLYGEGHP